MRKLLLVIFLVIMGFILVNRQRVFVRDPFATVYKSGPGGTTGPSGAEVKQTGVQVYINYSNDVLLQKEEGPDAYRTLVQNWNKVPGSPVVLKCLHWMACLTDADQASTLPIEPGRVDFRASPASAPTATMSSKEVSFVDSDGAIIRVALR